MGGATDVSGGFWQQVANIAGPDRTEKNNRLLASFLAFTAGMLNSVGFFAVAVYTSHMTGLTATLADQLVLGDFTLAFHAGVGIGSFITGAAMCALIFNWARRRGLASRFAIVLVIEALAILFIGLLAQSIAGHGYAWPVVAMLCWTMGLQNAIITKITGATIRTTHVTGMVTDIGIELGKWLYPKAKSDPDPVRHNPRALSLHVQIVVCFFAGGIIGAFLGMFLGLRTIIPIAAILLTVAIVPVWRDLRSGAFTAKRSADAHRSPQRD